MNINKEGLELIKEAESFRAKSYICPAGVPTIGWGTTKYPTGRKVTMKDKSITIGQANTYLAFDCIEIEKAIETLVKQPINENQFSALVSFAYNVGINALRNSTLLKKININPFDSSIKNEFERWNKARNPRSKKLEVLPGLEKRRKAEADLYFTPIKNVVV